LAYVHQKRGLLAQGSDGLHPVELGRSLPYYERFWAGGIDTLRGFDYRAVSPRDRAGHNVHIGGDKLLVFNAEVIFPLIKRMGIKGVVFGDAGNVYSYGNSFDPGNMRKDVGFGIRWRSLLGRCAWRSASRSTSVTRTTTRSRSTSRWVPRTEGSGFNISNAMRVVT